MAERSMNLQVANIAWACDISKKPGTTVPLYDYNTGFNVQLNWFPFDLKPRSEARVKIVEEGLRVAKQNGPLGGNW